LSGEPTFLEKRKVGYLTFGQPKPTAGLSPLQFGEGEGELPKGSSEGGEVISNIFRKIQQSLFKKFQPLRKKPANYVGPDIQNTGGCQPADGPNRRIDTKVIGRTLARNAWAML
jgi:hypothetical protein